LGADLPAAKAPYGRDHVANAIAAVMAAFDLVDEREADYRRLAAQVLILIADNAWNAGIVLGPPVRHWGTVDQFRSPTRLAKTGTPASLPP
jgi:2-keto-4-pentenoate hydratase